MGVPELLIGTKTYYVLGFLWVSLPASSFPELIYNKGSSCYVAITLASVLISILVV